MRLPKLSRLIILLAAASWLAACSGEASTWDRISSTGLLQVGLDPTYPPFATAEDGPLRGYDVELMRLIGKHLELEVSFTYFGYDGLYDALGTGQVDVLASALVIAPERTRDFAYTQPYFNAGERLVSRAADPVVGPERISPGRLAVELGATGHVVATRWERQFPGLEVRPFDTAVLAIDAVASGEVRAAVVDGVTALIHSSDNEDLTLGPQPVTDEPYALVVRYEDRELLDKMNEALDSMRASGQLSLLQQRWLRP